MTLMLNMIVRNEGARIERALKSVAPYISSWAILDTGSTDDTKERISTFFRHAAISGSLHDGEFINFSQARNDALNLARLTSVMHKPKFYLLMDADMELVVKDAKAFLDDRDGLVYEMYQYAGAMHYTNARLLSSAAAGGYVGPTHEYLDVPTSGCVPQEVAYFNDHADGANRPDKFKRDIRLLKTALEKEPNNARYMYYLASSYADAGNHEKAAKWFQRRINAGGWDQEVWQAEVRLAHAYKNMGRPNDFVATLLKAYSRRPTRAEAMYDLARWYRDQPKSQAAALACAEAVEHLPKSTDQLFVNDYVYDVGIKEEIAITAAYVPGKSDKGRRYNDELAIKTTPYWNARAGARANAYWYLKTLEEECPSFKRRNIQFTPPDGLVPMNPSVTAHWNSLYVNVRAVNYRIDDEGRYIIKATDGTANAENPIDTRNFVMELDLHDGTVFNPRECHHPDDMPCEFNLVTGFEDVRLFDIGGFLWSSATVRQFAADGQCEQVLTKIIGSYRHHTPKRMLREPRETEKNWAPILWSSEPMFMWRPGVVVNSDGKKVTDNQPPFETDNISGSSQVIHWPNGWLAIVHTAHSLPDNPHKRYYFHRFIEYTNDFRVRRMSLPFVFDERVIEFCAGMCRNPREPTKLVISYGFKDSEARVGTVSINDVSHFLSRGHVYDV